MSKWLLIGTGDIVRKRVAAALGDNLLGVCGGRERAEAIAAEHGAAEVFDDVETALRETQADLVYVATPVYRHADEAERALATGRPTLVEKPLGLSAKNAQRMVAAAAAADVTAGCAYYRRCFPRFAHLQQLLAAGELGRIVSVRTCYWSWFGPAADDPKYWRVDPALSGGGPLADMGSHMFDLIIGLFGLPAAVSAYCDTLAHDYEVEDTASIIMRFADGAQGTVSIGWHSKSWRHELEVIGSEGKVLWAPADDGPITITRGRETETLALANAANVHQPLIDDFVAAAGDRRAPICPLAEAAKTNRLLDAIYQSSAARQEVVL